MKSRIQKRLSVVTLVTLLLFNGIAFGVDAQKASAQTGILFKIKNGVRKAYDCIRGNIDTCTQDEIMVARIILCVVIERGIISPLYRKMQERSARVGAARRAERRAPYVTDGRLDLDAFRRDAALGFGIGTASTSTMRADDFDAAVTASLSGFSGGATVLTSAPQEFKERVNSFRSEHVSAQKKEKTCCVCFESGENVDGLGDIPCHGDDHPAQICYDCLYRVMQIHEFPQCPTCRGNLSCRADLL